MRSTRYILLILALQASCLLQAGEFKSDQLRYSRVREAYKVKEQSVKDLLAEKGIVLEQGIELYIRGLKEEKQLQVYARNRGQNTFQLVQTYAFCMLSGELGPKRQQGDGQVPEGFYHIDRFNPASSFHLSLGINYPNRSDRQRTTGRTGGDIFIHGSCVSIGCVPITDDWIKELYVLCVEARDRGQKQIPVHLFPFALTNEKLQRHAGSKHQALWQEMKPGFQHFEAKGTLPKPTISSDGRYVFAP